MKTVLITGATDGIGLEVARQMSAQKWRVLVHGRSREKVQKVLDELGENSFGYLADFSDMKQVAKLARKISKSEPRLDALINNAGVIMKEHEITKDGLEMTMAVNYFAPFILTHGLLDLMKRSAPARIINFSSRAHKFAKIDLDDLSIENKFSGRGAYSTSKLANLLFSNELSRRLPEGITSNALHPGIINTKLLRAGFGIIGVSPARGAQTATYLATNEQVADVSGEYFIKNKIAKPSRQATDAVLAAKLWEKSEKICKQYLPSNSILLTKSGTSNKL